MASDNRQFTDFTEFPGALDPTTGYFTTPTLYKEDSRGRVRSWRVDVRLIKTPQERLQGIDWDLLEENQLVIEDEYFLTDPLAKLPPKTNAQVWTTTGLIDGKQTRSNPTYVTRRANVGKANERHLFHQGLVKARKLFLDKKQKGFTPNPSGITDAVLHGGPNVMKQPMLASPWKTGSKHITYPVYVQEKYDGIRCLTFSETEEGEVPDLVLQTRSKKPILDKDYLKRCLGPSLSAFFDAEAGESLFLDGELYLKGVALQDISGRARRYRKKSTKKSPKDDGDEEKKEARLQYHVYDCFYPGELNTAYESRKAQLELFFEELNALGVIPALGCAPRDIVKFCPTYLCQNEGEVREIFDRVLSEGGEGVILRNAEGVYKTKTTRSKDLIKLKKLNSAEYKVVGYTQGETGKDRGAVIWIAETKSGQRFNVTPKNCTYEDRYRLFAECQESFDDVYSGRQMTVEYIELSKDKIPQHAKAAGFRDYE
jgi:hypothetical protein